MKWCKCALTSFFLTLNIYGGGLKHYEQTDKSNNFNESKYKKKKNFLSAVCSKATPKPAAAAS